MTQAYFVWVDEQGEGRNVHAYFRRDFTLPCLPTQGQIHLFADSRYHLRVNGVFVNYGPARFVPSAPEYDTYDLLPFLRPGHNTIAVHVVSHGVATFMCDLHIGGFIAWGQIKAGGKTIDLATPGAWRCCQARGYEPDAPVFSFTSAPIDIFDARRDIADWDKPNADLRWLPVVKLARQDAWGKLRQRSMPLLTQDEVRVQWLLGAYPLVNDEHILSFRLSKPGARTRAEMSETKWVFLYTYIHSPRRQTVRAGLFWGEYFLNGRMLKRTPSPLFLNRDDTILRLRRGWNFFFAKYGMCEGTWEFHMAVPKSANLVFSPTRQRRSRFAFMTAGPFTAAEENQVRALRLPFASPDDLPALSAGWVGRRGESLPVNPAYHLAWAKFGVPKENPCLKTHDLKADDREGTAFVFDLGRETLGRIFVDFTAPRGTVIDVGFAEHMHGNRPGILSRSMIYAGERCVARGGRMRFETFNPRGFRYLQINVAGSRGTATIHAAGAVEQVYPFAKVGHFACSEPLYNHLWEMGWRTLRLCSEDSYTDCPWRERHLYAGDMLVEFATTLATSGDTRLARRCLRLLTPPKTNLLDTFTSDFPLLTVINLAWYLDWTHDRSLAQELYPACRQMLENILNMPRWQGLFEAKKVFIDWTNMEKKGHLTTINSLIAAALSAVSRIAACLGRQAEAKKFAGAGRALARRVASFCWDAQAKAFRDGFQNGRPLASHYAASSALPAVFGQTTPAQTNGIAQKLVAILPQALGEPKNAACSPYGAFYIVGALYRLGKAALAERFLREAWGPFAQIGADTFWEHFPQSSPGRAFGPQASRLNVGWSHCHAWSSAPTFYLSTQLLGVNLGFPDRFDAKRVVISPHADGVTWARGAVPHPAGLVEVDWRISGDALHLKCRGPKGVSWEVRPRGRLAKLRLVVNGRLQAP